MNSETTTIRTLDPAEVGTLVGWAAAEGWNPGLDDAAAFGAADHEGFIGGFVDGDMVAGIAAVAYGGDFGFIGLYLCRADMRGRGHGKAVWDAAVARLGERTIGLDGVPEQQANYRSIGFVPAYRTVRFSGRFSGAYAGHGAIHEVTSEMLPDLVAYDRGCFPAERPAFLDRWLRRPRKAMAMVSHGAVTGYGVIRPCRDGSKIGPLFADDFEVARRLLAALAAGWVAGDVHIDVPEARRDLVDFLVAAGFSPGFETARMYLGRPPAIDAARVFGITSLELG